ncbi:MAG: hypothetical protein EAZ24_10365 [Burkholderiales bacterium]|nr:MAG: hypothetical protein EAZ24_10365 [Burkholderiales bacterium]TAG81074.1 MAG: hypothetical protein EAZ21_06840 [Betaproteobacteria bacterium]
MSRKSCRKKDHDRAKSSERASFELRIRNFACNQFETGVSWERLGPEVAKTLPSPEPGAAICRAKCVIPTLQIVEVRQFAATAIQSGHSVRTSETCVWPLQKAPAQAAPHSARVPRASES